ncbi:2-isopropylmalate synthase [Streptomyces cinnamoneus]|uniref:2-isopropylmalate synthase n=1 Tax=Streptomyces cinnamoneus TaxID=53446 RepID=A0A2G1XIS7_STRCJ|nr:2-isopropylmalate synthase [Streptomyces cinnamoneus]PHQ51152.1 2-isopropylmalate synthase [Streptomyces cinnamoneus]PPT13625.1 2-isopropylmalate synthase [Streptomyces cinnamoneus]
MPQTPPFPPAESRLRPPVGPSRPGQPWWNTQRASSMPVHRYVRTGPRLPEAPAERLWPARQLDRAPLWASVDLRDGNQSLANPMDSGRKGRMFDLLVRMGFKEIEVGYPSASDADFSFVRELITRDRIPDDVTISVFTPARPELIDRTFEAVEGADQAVVHLCHATACLWREVVFSMTPEEVERMAVASAERVARLADAAKGSRLRFEYSPETFNVTEPEFALGLSNTVAAVWDASPDRPVTLNLPTTVETDTPNVFADQVEWMHRNLDNRESVILSVHPHNDRGTAVASAELALMAGADRVEGTLFGNGERTGNVCLATMAMNLFSQGVDPQLDFSDIDEIRTTVEHCNQIPVHTRHPYAGDLVYTAFSGTHQDAIAKGLAAVEAQAKAAGTAPREVPWDVPYLPIDPKDVGRTYESVVRVNSQSGKGGIAHILKSVHGLDVPRGLRVELARTVQRVADAEGVELTSRDLWAVFSREYLEQPAPVLLLKEFRTETEGVDTTWIRASVVREDGRETAVEGRGAGAADAFAAALAGLGPDVRLTAVSHHAVADAHGERTAAYAEVIVAGTTVHGAGIDPSADAALVASVLSAVNRGLAR